MHTEQLINEAKDIQNYLAARSLRYGYDEEYAAAQSRLIRIKNPSANYNIARKAAIHTYQQAKKRGAYADYLSWARTSGLRELTRVKAQFSGLIVKGAA